jgi:GntR family transcriptional regulator, rspAB operon transcriptional repressor
VTTAEKSAPFLPLERAPTLTEDVYQQIRTAIVKRTLSPGERVTESALAKLLGVSKTPVREALVRLREVGLVRPDGRRGVRVVDLSSGVLDDAYEVREALELAAIERAMAAADTAGTGPIEAAARNAMQAAQDGDAESFARWDAAFHLELAGLSGNEHLVKLLRDTLDLIAAIRQGSPSQREASSACAAAHLEIVEALHAHDAAESACRLRRHIREGRERSMVEPPTPHL